MNNLKSINIFTTPHTKSTPLSIESLIWSIGIKSNWKLTPTEYSERIFLADLAMFNDMGTRLGDFSYEMTSDGLIVQNAIFERVIFLKSIRNNPNAFITLDQQKIISVINDGLDKYTRETWDETFHEFFYNFDAKNPYLKSHVAFQFACNTNKPMRYTIDDGLRDVYSESAPFIPIQYLFNFFNL